MAPEMSASLNWLPLPFLESDFNNDSVSLIPMAQTLGNSKSCSIYQYLWFINYERNNGSTNRSGLRTKMKPGFSRRGNLMDLPLDLNLKINWNFFVSRIFKKLGERKNGPSRQFGRWRCCQSQGSTDQNGPGTKKLRNLGPIRTSRSVDPDRRDTIWPLGFLFTRR